MAIQNRKEKVDYMNEIIPYGIIMTQIVGEVSKYCYIWDMMSVTISTISNIHILFF